MDGAALAAWVWWTPGQEELEGHNYVDPVKWGRLEAGFKAGTEVTPIVWKLFERQENISTHLETWRYLFRRTIL